MVGAQCFTNTISSSSSFFAKSYFLVRMAPRQGHLCHIDTFLDVN